MLDVINYLEKGIEKYLVDRVKAEGGTANKVTWINRRGAPDRYVTLHGRRVWVEVKSVGAKLKPHQAREHERMVAQGDEVIVLDTIFAVSNFIQETRRNKSC